MGSNFKPRHPKIADADGATELTIGRIDMVGTKRRKRRWTLAQLISGITEANRHSEISWASPVGEEFW
jgi:antitoxin component of MazEF toxin-antitoxin module